MMVVYWKRGMGWVGFSSFLLQDTQIKSVYDFKNISQLSIWFDLKERYDYTVQFTKQFSNTVTIYNNINVVHNTSICKYYNNLC